MQILIFCVLMALAFFSIGAAVFLTVAIVGSLVRLLICLMPYVVAIGLSFLLWGCGDAPMSLSVETHNPDFGMDWALTVIEATEEELGDTIDTDGMTIRIVPEVYPCPEITEAIACHRPGLIIIGLAKREMALAHELLHAYFLQTAGDSDHEHRRPEFEAVPESVRSTLLD